MGCACLQFVLRASVCVCLCGFFPLLWMKNHRVIVAAGGGGAAAAADSAWEMTCHVRVHNALAHAQVILGCKQSLFSLAGQANLHMRRRVCVCVRNKWATTPSTSRICPTLTYKLWSALNETYYRRHFGTHTHARTHTSLATSAAGKCAWVLLSLSV